MRERLQGLAPGDLPLRADLIGVASVLADDAGPWWQRPCAAAGRATCAFALRRPARTKDEAEAVVREVLALYTCGPAGGGGVRTGITPRLASDSCYVPRDCCAQPGASHEPGREVHHRIDPMTVRCCTTWPTREPATRATARRISVIAYEPAALGHRWWRRSPRNGWRALFAVRRPTAVRRYLLPRLQAMNFVLDDVLDGGVNGSLNLDTPRQGPVQPAAHLADPTRDMT